MQNLDSFLYALLALLLLAVPVQDSQAQTQFDLGPQAKFQLGMFSAPSVGVDARVDLEDLPVVINPTFDYFITGQSGVSVFQATANAIYEFSTDAAFTPYAGGGLAITYFSVGSSEFGGFGFSGSTTGLNAIGGAVFDMDNFKPFLEAQLVFGIGTVPAIGGGVLFDL